MQGQGLIRGAVKTSLGEPNKGLSHELDALAVYSNSHHFTLSPHAKGGLSESAERGRKLFLSEEVGCAKCHSGPLYTDSQLREPSQYLMHDVGTCGDDPTEKLGPGFDTPTLLSVYRTAPYLHDGKAATLQDVLTTCNKSDRHGRTSHLSATEIADLVEFLQALPYEDPESQAKSAGIPQVSR
jgi:cytochrome c peroxidase